MAQKPKLKAAKVAKATKTAAPASAAKRTAIQPSKAKSSKMKPGRFVKAPLAKSKPSKVQPLKSKPAAVVKSKAKPVATKAAKPAVKAKVTAKAIVAAAPKQSIASRFAAHKAAAAKAAPAAAAKAKAAVSSKPVAKAAAAKPVVPPAATARPAAAAPQRAVPAAIKPASQKISAPILAMPQPAAQAATPKALAEKAAAARGMMAAQKKPVSVRHGFKTNEFVVYPAHGVGRIVGIEEQEIAGMSLELLVITFDKEKLTLRVPTGKLASVGMRKLAEDSVVKRAMETLKGRARVKRTMWSRRAQEYVAKINSGDLISIAEVVRDLYRSEAQPEQSYSERQLYEDALERMARELAAVERFDERGAVQRIVEILSKSAKGRRQAAEDAEAAGAADSSIKAA